MLSACAQWELVLLPPLLPAISAKWLRAKPAHPMAARLASQDIHCLAIHASCVRLTVLTAWAKEYAVIVLQATVYL